MLLMAVSEYNGALAQLARALRWQRRGHRFESDMLHIKQKKPYDSAVFYLWKNSKVYF